ncbi:hypothetical protein FS749_008527 [Ceratobasidium sp. UAMH 11750]|nr:hypothetical protein FS749_008527 [Ceratobasidium sp. UAMH 11750]
MVGKKLNFYSYGLEGAATLILTFKPPDSPEPEPNRIPIAWKIIKLAPHAGVYSKATVHYIPRLAFGHAQSEDDSLVAPSIWIEVKNGDHTSITGEDDERHFTRQENHMTAIAGGSWRRVGRRRPPYSTVAMSGDKWR